MHSEQIEIRGARVHNLKNFDLKIPKNKFVVVTGPSGSGKSSLAFDLVCAESQRRFIESLSPKARQFLELMGRPDVDSISGLAPAIALSQKQARYGPSSTLASITEISDFLQILYSKLASPKCCGELLEKTSTQEIINKLCSLPEKTKLQLLIPWTTDQKDLPSVVDELKKNGFVRARFDGEIYSLDDEIEKKTAKVVEVVYDRIVIKKDIRERLADSVEECLRLSGGRLLVFHNADNSPPTSGPGRSPAPTKDGSGPRRGGAPPPPAGGESLAFYSTSFYCTSCNKRYPDISPKQLVLDSNRAESFYFYNKSYSDFHKLSLAETYEFILSLELSDYEKKLSDPLFSEIRSRISNLSHLGLSYLKLGHKAQHLSTGESQRVRLASCLSSELSGVLYILDEPSLGLDPDNVSCLIETLKNLRDQGNSILVVEHDEDIISAADYIIEMGPGAGEFGGEIVRCGESCGQVSPVGAGFIPARYQEKCDQAETITISNTPIPDKPSISIPLSTFTCLTGVSGSGKTRLLEHIFKTLSHDLDQKSSSKFSDQIEKVIFFDQSAIGSNPRSNPATYLDILTEIRSLLASIPEARLRGYKAGRFSFNTKGGRCEACEGNGQIQIEVNFLSDIFVECSLCMGKRFNFETLEIAYKGYNIHDILELSIDQALVVFQNIPKVSHKLRKLKEVGLSYLKLGQSAHTLSGGEAQRIKLAKELAKRQTGKTLYLFDEPTQGLSRSDVDKLMDIFRSLVDLGNTIVVAEHDRQVMEEADYLIEL